MHRTIFAFAILISLSINTSLWSQPPATTPKPNLDTAAAKEAQFESLFQELSNLVPGGVAAGSKTETALKASIELFGDRKGAQAQQALKDLAAADANFPPADLMVAALAYAVNDSKSGRRLLEQAAVGSAEYPGVYFSFGQLALTQQRFTDAEAHAELALQKIKSGSFTKLQIDHFKKRYYGVKFQTARARAKLDVARQLLKELEAVDPNAPQVLIGKAEMAFEEKKIDEAIVLLKQLNSSPAGKGKAQVPELTIAKWFQAKGKIENANLWIKKAAAEHADKPNVQVAAAQWALNREKFTDTLQAVKTLEAISGETNLSKEIRAKVAFAQGAYATAEEKFQSLLSANVNNIDYANMLALSKVQSTDEETQKKALVLARNVARAQPSNPIAISSLAYVMLKSGDAKGALPLLAKVAQLPNPNPEVSFIMAYMLSETGQMRQAQTVLEKVVQTKGLFLFRGEAKRLLKTVNQASQSLPERGQ